MPNYFRQRWSPLDAISAGQGMEQNLYKAGLEGQEMRDMMAAREAAALMGGGDYFSGYEGVPGALRPDYLKKLYKSGNPDVAMKMESFLTTPYALQREIAKAGAIEEAKKQADYRAMTNFLGAWLSGSGQPSAQFAPPGPAQSAGYQPNDTAIGQPTGGTMPGYRELSTQEQTFEMTPTGPRITFKSPSQFDTALKVDENKLKHLDADIKREEIDIHKDDLDIKRRLANKEISADRRAAVQQAHDNVRRVNDEILATQKAMQAREIPWEEGKRQIAELRGDLEDATAARDALLSGKAATSSAPRSAAEAAAALPPPISAAPVATPSAPKASGGQGGPGFTEKEQAAINLKDREEKVTAANKEITNARAGVQKILKFKRHINELYDLVTKHDIGHPAMEGIPGAASVLSMDKQNAQVKKLSEEIINMFAEPGQSQMMNTIVERQMQGAIVPGIFTEPQLNKINAAILRSNVEHLQTLPSFLERWQKKHGGTLDGAADAWIDYTQNNPGYIYRKDKAGKVKVMENSHVIPMDKWMDLSETGGIRTITDAYGSKRTFLRQDDGSWVERD